MRTLVGALVIPLVGMLALAACGDDDDSTADTATSVASSAVTTRPSTTGATSAPTTAAPTTAAATSVAPSTTGVSDTSTPDQPVSGEGVEIIVTMGEDDAVTLGSRVEHVPLGSDVTLRLYDPSKDQEYHVHEPYDLEQDVAAGTEAVFQFTADKPGKVDVESHMTDQVIVVLDVS